MIAQDFSFGINPWMGPGGGGFFFALFTLMPLSIVLLLWLLLARSTYLQGDDMERPSRVAQLYGYTVCLIAVVVFLISTNSLLENVFALSNPLQARESGYGFEPSVSSFESYRATYDREREIRSGPDAAAAKDSVPEAVLRARYEVLRADRIERVKFQAQRSLATSTLSLILAIALFIIHWRWLRSPSENGPVRGEVKGVFQ